MSLKSGVMIKSSVDIILPINIGEVYLNDCSFVSGGLYIIYVNDGEIIQTKLN